MPAATNASAPGGAPRAGRWRELAVLAAVTAVLRAPSFVRPFMDIDESSYAAIACRMLGGGLPYRDGVENKSPGIFYLYTAVFELFGRYNMAAVHVVTALVALGTALACGALARRLATPRAGFYAALLYAVFSTVYYPKMLAANTEMFVVLPASLAVLAHLGGERRRRLFLAAGAAAAMAALFKQVAGTLLIALFADRAWQALRGRRAPASAALDALLIAAGFGAVGLACVAYLAARGILGDAVFWSWTYVVHHYIPSGTRDHGYLFRLASDFLPFLAAISPLLFLAMRARPASAVCWWLAGATGGALVGGRMFGHYFLLMIPPLAVLAGLGADAWLAGSRAARRRRWLCAAVAAPALGFLILASLFEGATDSFWSPHPDYLRATDYARRISRPDDRVFVWGWFPALYVMSDRCPSTRFVYTHVLTGSRPEQARGHTVPEGWDMLLDDLGRDPPAIILDTSPGDYSYRHFPPEDFPRLWAFIESRYTPDATIEGVRFFRRATARAPARRQPGRAGAFASPAGQLTPVPPRPQ